MNCCKSDYHLCKNQIDIWVTFQDKIRDQRLLEEYEKLLTKEEKEQKNRFHFRKHQLQYLITRALIRTTLSKYSDIPPGEWRFGSNKYGKPETAQLPHFFNIAHTEKIIICGISREYPIGVDIEYFNRKEGLEHIAKRYFTEKEYRDLKSHPEHQQTERFYSYWTLKESFIKACGKGLSIPLDQFSFAIDGTRPPQVEIDQKLDEGNSKDWQFRQFKPSPEHIASVALKSGENSDVTLRVKNVIPLHHSFL